MSADIKVVPCQVRLLTVIEILSGNEVFGMRLKEIAEAVVGSGHRTTTATVLRDLQSLQAAGWAQQLDDNKWRLAAKPIQVLTNFQWGLQNASGKLAEVQQRYTRLSH